MDLSAVTVRATAEEDWKILKTIRLAALLDSPAAFGLSHATAAAYSEQQWRERASHETQPEFLMAIHQGQAVGLVGDAVSPTQEYNLIAMWVQPKYRGNGIAGRLVDAIKTRAIERGHQRVVLSVSPDNARAASLYRRHGFVFLPECEALASHPGVNVQKMEWRAGVLATGPSGADHVIQAVDLMERELFCSSSAGACRNRVIANGELETMAGASGCGYGMCLAQERCAYSRAGSDVDASGRLE
jgi:ribosomal protein S18 acetylase RimI-like enzyme